MVNRITMKILNQKTKTADYPFQTTSVYELEPTSDLFPESYIHIVQLIGQGYSSRKMKIGGFTSKVYQAVNNTFKVEYWRLHNHVSPAEDENVDREEDTQEYSFVKMIEYLNSDGSDIHAPDKIDFTKSKFVDHVNYDFAILRRYVVRKYSELQDNIDKNKIRIDELDYMFASNMTITTTGRNNTVIHDSVNHKNGENEDQWDACQLEIKDGNKISTKTWFVPETGMLVAYGWLDSSEALNNKAIPSSYCVLEGKINGTWEIIGVQSVVPAKTLTYVGFTLPVKKGLEIRARTGFTVGVKSGQFGNETDGYDTLSNSTPNGFKCQVFSSIPKND